MGVRDTSLISYEAIYKHLPESRREVYKAICQLNNRGLFPNRDDIMEHLNIKETNSVAPRITELERNRAIKSMGKRKNKNGRLMHVWSFTGEFWEAEKRETKAEYWKKLYEAKCQDYQHKCKELEILSVSEKAKQSISEVPLWEE